MDNFDHLQFFENFKLVFRQKLIQNIEIKEAYETTFKELFNEEFSRLGRKLNKVETELICELLEDFRRDNAIYE